MKHLGIAMLAFAMALQGQSNLDKQVQAEQTRLESQVAADPNYKAESDRIKRANHVTTDYSDSAAHRNAASKDRDAARASLMAKARNDAKYKAQAAKIDNLKKQRDAVK